MQKTLIFYQKKQHFKILNYFLIRKEGVILHQFILQIIGVIKKGRKIDLYLTIAPIIGIV